MLQSARAFVIKQDREELVRDDVLDDFGYIRKQAIEIERFRSDRTDLKQKIEKLGAFLEAHLGFTRSRHSLIASRDGRRERLLR